MVKIRVIMSQIQEVKEASDIVEVIGSKISLQRSGKYFRACCPFHSERSPSFFVDDVLQRYKCFGCGESGDVLTFLEKYEGMSFSEALEELATKAGITLQKFVKSQDDLVREQSLEVLSLAQQYYHYLLTKHNTGAPAREYLKERKITQESITLFQIGYAPDQWEGLINFLHKKKNYTLQVLDQAGLITQGKNGRYYDRFRGRIIFPLKDHRGRVVGFSGRKLGGDEKDAKYINSPETVLYHKSKMLFGFSELYQEIRKAGFIAVVEGEFDVISSTQAHMNSVVAIKGSALTQEHAKLLERTVDTVLLSLDTDSAGVAATKKAITALQKTEIQLRVIVIPDGKDPDDLIKTNPKLWRNAVKESITAHEFLIMVAFKQFDQKTPEGKKAIMKELLPVLSQIEHMVELEHYSREVAQKLGVQLESVKADIQQYKNKKSITSQLPKRSQAAEKKPAIKKETAQERLERYVVFLLFQTQPAKIFEQLRNLQSQEITFTIPGLTQIIRALESYSGVFELKRFASKLPTDLQEVLFDIHAHQDFIKNLQEIDIQAEWQGSLTQLRRMVLTGKKQEIIDQITQLDEKQQLSQAEQEEHNTLLRKLAQLNATEKVANL